MREQAHARRNVSVVTVRQLDLIARRVHGPLSLAAVMRHCVRRWARECEASHLCIAAPALLLGTAGGGLSRIAAMTTRRVMSWWFRFVLSGRFLDRFLCLPRAH
jgi:hypothetical protein